MVDSMVSTEDKRYYLHPGVDPIGMARAAWVAMERRGSGRRWQGASTITQQVTRNIFLNNSYSWGRKIGRASCRERVWQYVLISVVAVSLKTHNILTVLTTLDITLYIHPTKS